MPAAQQIIGGNVLQPEAMEAARIGAEVYETVPAGACSRNGSATTRNSAASIKGGAVAFPGRSPWRDKEAPVCDRLAWRTGPGAGKP